MPPFNVSSRTFLLRTKEDLPNTLKKLSDFLKLAMQFTFWRTHFANQNFFLDSKNLNVDLWNKIPFLTIEDLLKIGIEPRLVDATPLLKKYIYRCFLRSVDKKIKNQQILLFDYIHKTHRKKYSGMTINITDSYAISLRQVLASLYSGLKEDNFIITSHMMDEKIKTALNELKITQLSGKLDNLIQYSKVLLDSKAKNYVKRVFLRDSFVSPSQLEKLKNSFIKSAYIFSSPRRGIAMVVKPCKYVQMRFGPDAVHPAKHVLIELLNMNDKGIGEIVITTTRPVEVAWIRYRTGRFGRAIFETCECGARWILVYERVKKYKYSVDEERSERYNAQTNGTR